MTDIAALSIGAIAGGPGTHKRWNTSVMSLMRAVKQSSVLVQSPLAVNVVYQIPGNNLTPEFKGLRTGRFSRKTRHLMIQVALPQEPDTCADDEVRVLLRSAVLMAEEFAQLEGLLEGKLMELRALADSV